MRFTIVLIVAALAAALAGLAVRAGLPQPLGVVLLLVVLGIGIVAIVRTPAWGRSIQRSRSRY